MNNKIYSVRNSETILLSPIIHVSILQKETIRSKTTVQYLEISSLPLEYIIFLILKTLEL